MALHPCVIDMNHADASEEVGGKLVDRVDFAKAKAWGVRGIIHKATEGRDFKDQLYESRRAKALELGLLWGGYHFMRPGDVGQQASFFLGTVGHGQGTTFTRYVLDYEDPKLALWQALAFLEIVHNVTHQRAWLYSGFLVREQAERRDPGPVLAQYPLWLAEYSTVAKVPRPWSKCVLWQRSGDGEGPGPHDIPGIGRKQDVNWYDGTDQDLENAWLDMGVKTEVA